MIAAAWLSMITASKNPRLAGAISPTPIGRVVAIKGVAKITRRGGKSVDIKIHPPKDGKFFYIFDQDRLQFERNQPNAKKAVVFVKYSPFSTQSIKNRDDGKIFHLVAPAGVWSKCIVATNGLRDLQLSTTMELLKGPFWGTNLSSDGCPIELAHEFGSTTKATLKLIDAESGKLIVPPISVRVQELTIASSAWNVLLKRNSSEAVKRLNLEISAEGIDGKTQFVLIQKRLEAKMLAKLSTIQKELLSHIKGAHYVQGNEGENTQKMTEEEKTYYYLVTAGVYAEFGMTFDAYLRLRKACQALPKDDPWSELLQRISKANGVRN